LDFLASLEPIEPPHWRCPVGIGAEPVHRVGRKDNGLPLADCRDDLVGHGTIPSTTRSHQTSPRVALTGGDAPRRATLLVPPPSKRRLDLRGLAAADLEHDDPARRENGKGGL